jgi:hypothetical protein
LTHLFLVSETLLTQLPDGRHRRFPNFRQSRTARRRSSYERMNYLQAVQVFVRTPTAKRQKISLLVDSRIKSIYLRICRKLPRERCCDDRPVTHCNVKLLTASVNARAC